MAKPNYSFEKRQRELASRRRKTRKTRRSAPSVKQAKAKRQPPRRPAVTRLADSHPRLGGCRCLLRMPTLLGDRACPVITAPCSPRERRALRAARDAGETAWSGSLDLAAAPMSPHSPVGLEMAQASAIRGPARSRTHAVLVDGERFAPISRYAGSDQVGADRRGRADLRDRRHKRLRPRSLKPLDDARRKVALVQPPADRAGYLRGLGYSPACCLDAVPRASTRTERTGTCCGYARSTRGRGSRSPSSSGRLRLRMPTVAGNHRLARWIIRLRLARPAALRHRRRAVSQVFYDQLARVLKRGGRLFHYTGRRTNYQWTRRAARSGESWKKPLPRRTRSGCVLAVRR